MYVVQQVWDVTFVPTALSVPSDSEHSKSPSYDFLGIWSSERSFDALVSQVRPQCWTGESFSIQTSVFGGRFF